MAICMKMDAGHIHEEVCDQEAQERAGGRTTTVMAVRMPDDQARAIRDLMTNSRRGYDSFGEFVNHLITSQALRKRGTQLTARRQNNG